MNENATRYRIARWLRAILEGPRAVGTRPDQLLLRHVTLNERQVEIAWFPISPAANDNGLDLGDLAMRIEETARDDAEGLGGLQRYVVHAVLEERPVSRLPFRLSGGGEVSPSSGVDDSLDSEPASGRGLLAQGMRHLEAMTRLHAEALGQLVITQQRTIGRLAEVNESGEERRLKAVETAEAMMSEKQERLLKVQESAHRQEMLSSFVGQVIPVGGAIINHLTGAGEKRANHLLALHTELLARLAKDPAKLERILAEMSVEERSIFETILDSVPPPPGAPSAAPPGGEPAPAGGPPPPGPPRAAPPPTARAAPVSSGGAGQESRPPGQGPHPRRSTRPHGARPGVDR